MMQIDFLGWESTYSGPDDDGDIWITGNATFEVTGGPTVDLVVLQHVVTAEDGTPLWTERTEEAEELDDGETLQLACTGFTKGDFTGTSGSVYVELQSRQKRMLGQAPLPAEGKQSGSGEHLDLGDGLTLLGWSLSTDPPDGDGDSRTTMVMVVRNDGDQVFAKVEGHLSLKKRSGDTLEDGSDEVSGLAPGQLVALEARVYYKPRWLTKGVVVDVSVHGFKVLACATSPSSTLEQRQR